MVQTALSIRSNYKAEKCPLCEDTGSQEVTAALYKDIIGFLADALRRKVTCGVFVLSVVTVVCGSANFGVDPIQSKYRAKNCTDTFNL